MLVVDVICLHTNYAFMKNGPSVFKPSHGFYGRTVRDLNPKLNDDESKMSSLTLFYSRKPY